VLVTLDTPYADSKAADLRFTLSRPLLPALATLKLGNLEFRLLGASHQVVCNGLIETVACLPTGVPGLPERHERPGYIFQAAVRRPDDFSAQVDELKRRDNILAGEFPGSPDALTVIGATENGWWTVHAYPQTGELVTTRTEVRW
jgi:hypothetical protein